MNRVKGRRSKVYPQVFEGWAFTPVLIRLGIGTKWPLSRPLVYFAERDRRKTRVIEVDREFSNFLFSFSFSFRSRYRDLLSLQERKSNKLAKRCVSHNTSIPEILQRIGAKKITNYSLKTNHRNNIFIFTRNVTSFRFVISSTRSDYIPFEY